ncbi:doublesex- and mab-3-related transcription factor B1 [Balaenoptera ricei]|uniref:doublesex- and mab-3-related transcription factor B1 n=1 Tax=Balaenoptera ricei TaxID=2746895 RepID=UPI0028BEA00E|nr:doublesex- and mab-3-related transcription factor B1 [Balaenoptera ricei]
MQADLAKLADKMLRAPRCCRCRNHGFLVPLKGHAGKCRWKQCTCEKCYLITQRQKIMAAQQVLTNQAYEEEQEVALCVQGPQLASGAAAAAAVLGSSFRTLPLPAASGVAHPGPEGRAAAFFPERRPRGPSPGPGAFQPVLGGRGHVGPRERAAATMPSSLRPQLGAEAPGRGCPGRLELRRPLRPALSPPFADFGPPLSVNSDHVVGSEHLEREPSKRYRSCSSMQPYHPFLLGYQDASLTPGVPLQQDFRHVSCSHYHGAGLERLHYTVRLEGGHPPGPATLESESLHVQKVVEPVEDLQPGYYLPPPPPQFPPPPPQFPPRYLSVLHCLPPPPSFSLSIVSDVDTDDQYAEGPCEPSQPSSQEQSD